MLESRSTLNLERNTVGKPRNARMEIYLPSDEEKETYQCEIQLIDDVLHLTQKFDDGDHLYYKGREVGPGHYQLVAEDAEGTSSGSLHRFPDGMIFEGYWVAKFSDRSRDEGMWRIYVDPSS